VVKGKVESAAEPGKEKNESVMTVAAGIAAAIADGTTLYNENSVNKSNLKKTGAVDSHTFIS